MNKTNTTASGWHSGVTIVFFVITIAYSNSASVAPDLLGLYSLFSLAFVLGVVAVVARAVLSRDLPGSNINQFAVALVAWASTSLLSLLTSDVTGLSLVSAYADIWRAIGFAIVLFLLIERIEQFRIALAAIMVVTIAWAALTVLQYAFGLQDNDFYGWALGSLEQISGDTQSFRPSGPIGDPNYYGMYLIPGVLLLLHQVVSSGALTKRLFFGLCVSIVVFAIALTASRGASFALIVVSSAWLLVERNAWRTVSLVAVGIFVILIFSPEYLQRLLTPVEFFVRTVFDGRSLGVNIDESSVFGRFAQMQASLILFVEHPVTGVGFAQFESFFQAQSVQHNLLMRGADRSAHNYFLEIAAEQGAIGLFGFFVFLVMLSRSISDASRRLIHLGMSKDAQLVRTFGYAIFATLLSLTTLQDSHPLQLWILFAVAFSANNVVPYVGLKAPHAHEEART